MQEQIKVEIITMIIIKIVKIFIIKMIIMRKIQVAMARGVQDRLEEVVAQVTLLHLRHRQLHLCHNQT